ncbi:MAG: LysR family transcriptional regulator [Rubrivivax sp.]
MDRFDMLRAFLRVAATGSFSQAADQLGLPRPTVSLAVQRLEARLGVRLFHRTTRKVGLTPDGEALRGRAAALVDDLEDLEARFQPHGDDGGVAGRLRVDVPSRIGRLLIAPALPTLLDRHPRLEIELGSSDRAIDLVLEGVDCALRVGTLADSSLVARPLGRLALINCASPGYLQRHGTPRSPQDLAQHRAVQYLSPASGRAAPWEWVDEGGVPRSMHVEGSVGVNNAETYIACALTGLGLIQIPRYDVLPHLEDGSLVEVLPRHVPAPMPAQMVYPHRKHLSRRVQAFIAWTAGLLGGHLAA